MPLPRPGGCSGLPGPLCPAGVGEHRSGQMASFWLIGRLILPRSPAFLLAFPPGAAAPRPEGLDAGDGNAGGKSWPEAAALQLPPLGGGEDAVSQALFVWGINCSVSWLLCCFKGTGRPACSSNCSRGGRAGDTPHSKLTPLPPRLPFLSASPPFGTQALEGSREQLSSYSQTSVLIAHLFGLVSCQRPGYSHTRSS